MSDEKTWRDYLVCERCGLFREDECECGGREHALLLELERAARDSERFLGGYMGERYRQCEEARSALQEALAALDEFRKSNPTKGNES